jgi:multidrug resistance efflux pump
MPSELPGNQETVGSVLNELGQLRQFSGPPKEFWGRYLQCLGRLTTASKSVLLLQDTAQPSAWKRIGDWPPNLPPSRLLTLFNTQIEALAVRASREPEVMAPLLEPGAARTVVGHFALACRLRLYRANEVCVATLLISEVTEATAREALVRLTLAADVPESYQMGQAIRQASTDVEKLAVAHDLVSEVNQQKRFLAAALAFCNGLATRFRSQRVSLGWLQGGYIKLRAISQTERFNAKMEAARLLEDAMDESLDQDEEILWPAPEGSTFVSRDHARFGANQSPGNLCSVPLRLEGKPIAVITCERQDGAFHAIELQQLRLCCDQATPRLADLHRRDRWLGAQLATWTKEKLAVVLGPKHTWAKTVAVVVMILLAVLLFLRVPYRVEGNFVLKSDEVSFRTAPFDGYLEQVWVRPGDTVRSNAPLVKLMTRELELEQSAALADVGRYQREAEKARATNGLAEMRIAQALGEQSRARLDLVRHRLAEATIHAPFEGVVVEGDLRERLAAPVKQGDALLKIARLEKLYVEAEVNERDVHDILNKREGEIAFVSQPKLKFPVRIVKVEPAAFPRTEGNVFIVRCECPRGLEPWWRPGMSGLCKLNVERRTLGWILTHRTVDFLRMKLWW